MNGDYTAPAALAAKALGKPVKLVLTRPDDLAVRLVSLAVMRTYPIGGGFGRRLSSGLPPVELLKQTQQWPWYSMLSYQNPWILERSEGLCEPDLHVFAKFFEDAFGKGS